MESEQPAGRLAAIPAWPGPALACSWPLDRRQAGWPATGPRRRGGKLRSRHELTPPTRRTAKQLPTGCGKAKGRSPPKGAMERSSSRLSKKSLSAPKHLNLPEKARAGVFKHTTPFPSPTESGVSAVEPVGLLDREDTLAAKRPATASARRQSANGSRDPSAGLPRRGACTEVTGPNDRSASVAPSALSPAATTCPMPSLA